LDFISLIEQMENMGLDLISDQSLEVTTHTHTHTHIYITIVFVQSM